MPYDLSSRARLSREALPRFPGDTLFCRIARVVCAAECLPRKELFESWEVARRVRRRFRGGRVVDLASGHGLIAMIMLVLDDTSKSALAVDAELPASAMRLLAAFEAAWPRLRGRIELRTCTLDRVELRTTDVVVSAHACGPLSDRVLELAVGAQARVALLPCCHSERECDLGGLGGWVDASLAIDVTRAARLRAHGYRVYTQRIPPTITPQNRLLLGEPMDPDPAGSG